MNIGLIIGLITLLVIIIIVIVIYAIPKPIDGGWSNFSVDGECSSPCGDGSVTNKRTCTNPKPENDGKDCVGDDFITKECNVKPCPINGGWSNISDDWGNCTATCGGGIRKKTKTCTNPKPEFGGSDCVGDDFISEECNTQKCPIRARYVKYSNGPDYQNLSKIWVFNEKNENISNGKPVSSTSQLNSNTPNRHLTGNNKYNIVHTGPSDYGKNKNAGWTIDLGSTNTISLVHILNRVDCCKERINGAIITLLDENMKIVYKSENIKGNSAEYLINPFENTTTSKDPIPINGGWSNLSDWGNCTATCGGGIRKKTKTCTNPKPEFGGSDCVGDDFISEECNTQKCPIRARYVKYSNGPDYQNLSKIWVFNEKNENISNGKPVSSTSQLNSNTPNRHLTGNNKYNIVHTGPSDYGKNKNAGWTIDLGSTNTISLVHILNRVDCCKERINGAIITLLDENMKIVYKSENIKGNSAEYLINPFENTTTSK
jgi:hypothetical protein